MRFTAAWTRWLGPALACPFCFRPFRLEECPRRCEAEPGRCAPEPDALLGRHLGLPAPPPLGQVVPPGAEACGRCGGTLLRRLCPHCHSHLPVRIGQVPHRVIALLGGPGAGKSSYLAALIERLGAVAGPRLDAVLAPEGEESVRLYRHGYYDPLYRRAETLPPTAPATRNPSVRQPLVYRLDFTSAAPGLSVTLALYDTAGSDLGEVARMARAAPQLSHADAYLLLIDPASLPASGVSGASGEPAEDLVARLLALHEQAGALGAGARFKRPVALALGKLDRLTDAIEPHSPLLREGAHEGGLDLEDLVLVNDEVGAYLGAWRAGNLLSLARRRLADHAFFAVSSLGAATNGDGPRRPAPFRVEDPLLWLLWRLGFLEPKRGRKRADRPDRAAHGD
jgi:hypothetical protein